MYTSNTGSPASSLDTGLCPLFLYTNVEALCWADFPYQISVFKCFGTQSESERIAWPNSSKSNKRKVTNKFSDISITDISRTYDIVGTITQKETVYYYLYVSFVGVFVNAAFDVRFMNEWKGIGGKAAEINNLKSCVTNYETSC